MRTWFRLAGVGVKFGAKVEIMWKFKRICHISAADSLDFFRTQRVGGSGRTKPVPQQAHRPLANGKENVFLILEIHVDQGARQARATGELIDRDEVPAFLGVERF